MNEYKSASMSYHELIQFVRLARGLEAGGFYNAAKLFWSALRSMEIKASNEEGLPKDHENLTREYKDALDLLQTRETNEEFLQAVKRGFQGVQENRTIPLAEITRTFVCRKCGEIILSGQPINCPFCGAQDVTLREFDPIYYLETLHPQEALAALESAPDELEAACLDLDETQLTQPPKAGSWSMRDLFKHLLASNGLLAARIDRMLAENNPSLKGVAAWAMTKEPQLSVKDILNRFTISRRATVDRLRRLPTNDWWRTAWHEEFGKINILQQVSYFTRHERDHFSQIYEIREAVGAPRFPLAMR